MQAKRIAIIFALVSFFLFLGATKTNAQCTGSGPMIHQVCDTASCHFQTLSGGIAQCTGSSSSNCQRQSFAGDSSCTYRPQEAYCDKGTYKVTFTSSGCSWNGSSPGGGSTPTPSCNNTCTAGDKKCSGGGSQSCGLGSDGCYHWGAVTPCSGGCYQGSCCANTCTPGDSKCSGGNVQTCRGNGSQCNSWETTTCQYGCLNGSCRNCVSAGGACGSGQGQCCSGSCSGGICGGAPPVTCPGGLPPGYNACSGGSCVHFDECGTSSCTSSAQCGTPTPRPTSAYANVCGTSCSCIVVLSSSIRYLDWDGGCGATGEACTPRFNPRDSDSPYRGIWAGGQGGFSVSVVPSPRTGPLGFTPQVTISLHDEISRRIRPGTLSTYNYSISWDSSHNDGGTFTNAECTTYGVSSPVDCTKTLTAPANVYTTVGGYPITFAVSFRAPVAGGAFSCRELGEMCGTFDQMCCDGLGCQAGRCFPVGSSVTNIIASYTAYVGVEPACMSGAGTEGPTSTPGEGGGWIKLVNTSFTSLGSLNNPLPTAPEKYDNSASDPGRRYFIDDNGLSDPGEVIAETINVGTHITNAGSTVSNDVSSKNWKVQGMSFSPSTKVSSFIAYLKARKNYQKIEESQLPLISQITSDNAIYHILGDRTISDNGISARDNVVLVFDGDLTITTPRFNVLNAGGGRSIAILVQGNLTIDPSVTELNGLYIVEGTITTGTVNQGVKITGNLITQTSLSNGRTRSDNNQPSVLVVFDPNYYLDLLPYLSINTYDWRQLR